MECEAKIGAFYETGSPLISSQSAGESSFCEIQLHCQQLDFTPNAPRDEYNSHKGDV